MSECAGVRVCRGSGHDGTGTQTGLMETGVVKYRWSLSAHGKVGGRGNP